MAGLVYTSGSHCLQERMMTELGKGTFGEDRVQTFKSVVECFEKIGQERLDSRDQ